MGALSQMRCVACRKSEPTLTESQIHRYMPQVPEWRVKEVNGEKRLDPTNKAGPTAEQEDHHPF